MRQTLCVVDGVVRCSLYNLNITHKRCLCPILEEPVLSHIAYSACYVSPTNTYFKQLHLLPKMG